MVFEQRTRVQCKPVYVRRESFRRCDCEGAQRFCTSALLLKQSRVRKRFPLGHNKQHKRACQPMYHLPLRTRLKRGSAVSVMGCLALLFCMLSMGSGIAAAEDHVSLTNGDRISGEVVSINDGVVVVRTAYAGDISIERDAVALIETATPRVLMLSAEHQVAGRLTSEDGTAGIVVDGVFEPLPPSSIVAMASDTETLEQMIHPPPPSKWSGVVDLGLALRSGNTDTTDVKFSAGAKRKGSRTKLALGVGAAYGSTDGVINTRQFHGDFRWQYYLRDRLYTYTMGLAERDDGRKLDHRFQGGGGLGYDIIDRENRSLSADIGLTYTRERWAPFTPWEREQKRDAIRYDAYNRLYAALMAAGDNTDLSLRSVLERVQAIYQDIRDPLRGYRRRNEAYVNVRMGVDYEQNIFRASTFTGSMVVMPNLEDVGEFRAVSTLALSTPVTDALSLRTSLKTEYDSLAKERGVDRWDNTLMTQLRYKF